MAHRLRLAPILTPSAGIYARLGGSELQEKAWPARVLSLPANRKQPRRPQPSGLHRAGCCTRLARRAPRPCLILLGICQHAALRLAHHAQHQRLAILRTSRAVQRKGEGQGRHELQPSGDTMGAPRVQAGCDDAWMYDGRPSRADWFMRVSLVCWCSTGWRPGFPSCSSPQACPQAAGPRVTSHPPRYDRHPRPGSACWGWCRPAKGGWSGVCGVQGCKHDQHAASTGRCAACARQCMRPTGCHPGPTLKASVTPRMASAGACSEGTAVVAWHPQQTRGGRRREPASGSCAAHDIGAHRQ